MVKDSAVLRLCENGEIEILACPQNIKQCQGKLPGSKVHPLVAMFMIYSGIAVLYDDRGCELSLEELLKRMNKRELWITFSVYLDLLKRGRRVEPGVADNELVLEKLRVKVYVFEENSLVKPEMLIDIIEKASRQDYKVVIAVVDMYGDVTYYEVSKISFPVIERRDRVW